MRHLRYVNPYNDRQFRSLSIPKQEGPYLFNQEKYLLVSGQGICQLQDGKNMYTLKGWLLSCYEQGTYPFGN